MSSSAAVPWTSIKTNSVTILGPLCVYVYHLVFKCMFSHENAFKQCRLLCTWICIWTWETIMLSDHIPAKVQKVVAGMDIWDYIFTWIRFFWNFGMGEPRTRVLSCQITSSWKVIVTTIGIKWTWSFILQLISWKQVSPPSKIVQKLENYLIVTND